MLSIKEIYKSIQGETSFAGLPCVFVRLAACDLRCSYCDSEYAFTGGKPMSIDQVADQVTGNLVTVTGGEPLLQPDVFPLITRLCDAGRTVLVETSGAHDIDPIDKRAVVIMDMKCPSSGEHSDESNLAKVKPADELKFVIATQEDYAWAKSKILNLKSQILNILFTWAAPPPSHKTLKAVPKDHHPISMRALAEKILADNLPVRFLPQIHKIIWEADAESR